MKYEKIPLGQGLANNLCTKMDLIDNQNDWEFLDGSQKNVEIWGATCCETAKHHFSASVPFSLHCCYYTKISFCLWIVAHVGWLRILSRSALKPQSLRVLIPWFNSSWFYWLTQLGGTNLWSQLELCWQTPGPNGGGGVSCVHCLRRAHTFVWHIRLVGLLIVNYLATHWASFIISIKAPPPNTHTHTHAHTHSLVFI